jgi:hypothetical protein
MFCDRQFCPTHSIAQRHSRAYQSQHLDCVPNGHLVKRWPNEELLLPGQLLDPVLIAALCNEESEEG